MRLHIKNIYSPRPAITVLISPVAGAIFTEDNKTSGTLQLAPTRDQLYFSSQWELTIRNQVKFAFLLFKHLLQLIT